MPKKISQTDIRLYHELKLQAQKMQEVFAFLEAEEYSKCISYRYDSEACEESCLYTKINRLGKDFHPEEECWECAEFTKRSKKTV